MIAQLLLTALLAFVLVYAWSAHRTVPIIGLLASGAALAGLYFVWVPGHATALATFVGIGRGTDLIVYTWVVHHAQLASQAAAPARHDHAAGARRGDRSRQGEPA
jgi:hypothetical protein